MGKVLKTIAMVAAIGALVVATGGLALFGTTAGITLFGVSAATLTLVSLGAGIAATLLTPKPKIPASQLSRLNVGLDPSTPRKVVFGTTAMPLDIRYHESSGTDQEYVDYIIAVAAHKVTSIDEIWFEEKQAWTASGGVTATYSGYLTVTTRTEGTSGNYISINGGAKWGSTRRMTGCAYLHLRIKRTGNTKKAESPLVAGLPSRVTVIGNGALLYDPRRDSTVAGGSGSHRATDQTTWGVYTDADDTDNPALQLLWWLLGWKINGKLSVGSGVPYTRIDMPSFITAANICDENVTLAIGGTQKRYRTSGTASDADSRMEIIDTFLMSMNGTIRDNGGKLKLIVMKNDLAEYVLQLDETAMLADFDWQQTGSLTENYNVARGRFIDPSNNSLYQMVDYPEVGFASPDGIERVLSVDLAYVEDGRRAQRIAKQVLQRNQYRGVFSAVFNAKALGCQVGDIVLLSLEALGFASKPFRVISQEIRFDGQVPMALLEENAAIYAWDTSDVAPITPTAPTIYDPLNSPFILGIEDAGTTANYSGIVDDDGNKPDDNATRNVNRGAWSGSSVAYIIGDFVQRDGSSYSAIVAHTSTAGNGPPGANWTLLASQGINGDNGTNGLNNAVVYLYQRATTAPAAPSGTFTYTFATGLLSGGTPGSWTQTIPAVNGNPLWVIAATASSSTATDSIAATEFSSAVKLVQDGTDGAPGAAGTPAITGYLTREAVQLFSYANGAIVSYSPASGSFKVFSGNTDVSTSFSLSTLSNPETLTVSYSGQTYSVTAGFDAGEDTATLGIRATGSGAYAGITIDKLFSLSKAKGGYEIVATLPSTDLFEGRVVFLTTDDKLYRYTGAAWTSAVPAVDISGTLADAQIAAVAAAKVTGTLSDSQLAAIAATKITGQITNVQIADVAAIKVSGQLTSTQIADLAATKVTGQLTDAQISALAATKVTGQIVSTQITDAAITSAKIVAGAIIAGKIAADAVTANEIAANSITASEIAAGAIIAGKIAADAVTANEIAANSITASEIAAGAVTAGKIAANSVTASEIAANTITSSQIAANTITANQIAASTITATQIAANAITATEIAAGAVVAGKVAALAITAAEIAAGTITGAKIAAGTIAAGNIVADTITANEIAANAITATEIATNAITADKILAGAITSAKVSTNEIVAFSANIADGVIQTAKIGDLQVSTLKIGNFAVSSLSAAATTTAITIPAYTTSGYILQVAFTKLGGTESNLFIRMTATPSSSNMICYGILDFTGPGGGGASAITSVVGSAGNGTFSTAIPLVIDFIHTNQTAGYYVYSIKFDNQYGPSSVNLTGFSPVTLSVQEIKK